MRKAKQAAPAENQRDVRLLWGPDVFEALVALVVADLLRYPPSKP